VTVFFQHAGERGGGRDFPRTIGTPETGLVRFNFDDIEQYLEHLEPPQRKWLAAETALQAPDGFQIWGIPSGARSVLSSLAPGDYLLLLESPGPGGTFVYGGRIIAAPTAVPADRVHHGSPDQLSLAHVLRGAWLQAELEPGNKYLPDNGRETRGSAYPDEETLIRHVVGADLAPAGEATFASDLFQDPAEELIGTEEGRSLLRLHLVRERSLALVRSFKRTLRDFQCSVCSFNFEQVYGEIGRDFIEAHHTKPVASLEENERVSVKDLLAVCSNCHRMLHRRVPVLTVDELKAHLAEAVRQPKRAGVIQVGEKSTSQLPTQGLRHGNNVPGFIAWAAIEPPPG